MQLYDKVTHNYHKNTASLLHNLSDDKHAAIDCGISIIVKALQSNLYMLIIDSGVIIKNSILGKCYYFPSTSIVCGHFLPSQHLLQQWTLCAEFFCLRCFMKLLAFLPDSVVPPLDIFSHSPEVHPDISHILCHLLISLTIYTRLMICGFREYKYA